MSEQSLKKSDSRSKIAFGRLGPALRFYRIMAFTTGVVLVLGTLGLILQQVPSVDVPSAVLGPLWIAHGYLFIVYVIAAINLGLHLRWHPVRVLLVAAAGTVPTMSFVAENSVMRRLR